jgi:hypothetical protein
MLGLRRGYLRIGYRRIGIDKLRGVHAGLLCDGSVDRVHKLRGGLLPAELGLGLMLGVSRGLVLRGDGSCGGDGAVLCGQVLGLICEHVLELLGGHVPVEHELKLLLSMPRGILLLDEWPLRKDAMPSW